MNNSILDISNIGFKTLNIVNNNLLKNIKVTNSLDIKYIYLKYIPNLAHVEILNNSKLKYVVLGEGLQNLISINIKGSESVKIVDQKFTKLRSLNLLYIKKLNININEHYYNLNKLQIRNCVLVNNRLSTKCKFNKLKEFYFVGCNLYSMSISFDLTNIEFMSLEGNMMDSLQLNGTFKKLVNLSLDGNKIKTCNINVDFSNYKNDEVTSINVDHDFKIPINLKRLIDNKRIEIYVEGYFTDSKKVNYI